jgi:hypothetical protein
LGFVCAFGAAAACSSFESATDTTDAGPDAAADGVPPSPPGSDAATDTSCPNCNSRFCSRDGKCDLLVFVSGEIRDGNLGGPAGGDGICRVAATDAGFANPTTFLAWLSADNADGPIVRAVTLFDRPYRRVDGTLVADGGADFLEGHLAAPIGIDEHGKPANPVVWADSHADAAATGDNCGRWLTNQLISTGGTGASAKTDTGWSETAVQPCNQQHPVYCFEVLP